MRTLRLCLAALTLTSLTGCAEPEPNPIHIWDVRASPRVCPGNDEGDYYCTSYNLVGDDYSFNEDVDGFDPAWGRTYQIEVEQIGEGASVRYALVELLDEQTEPGLEFDIELLFDWVDVQEDGGTIEQYPFACTPEQYTELSALRSALELDQHIQATFRFGPDSQLFPLELISFELVDA